MELGPPAFEERLDILTYFQQMEYGGGGGEVTLQWKNLVGSTLARDEG